MAEERDAQVSRRYRELGSEEPPRALDDAILAASRRSVSSRRGWYVPLAAAAVALLAVGIALHVEREKPDAELMTAPSDARQAPAEIKQEQPPAAAQPEPKLREPEAEHRDSERRFGFSREEAPAPSASPAPIPQTAPVQRPGALSEAAPARKAAQADALEETPERALERIAELRKHGRHEEADKALAEFRQRYPAYRIPESMLGKVQK